MKYIMKKMQNNKILHVTEIDEKIDKNIDEKTGENWQKFDVNKMKNKQKKAKLKNLNINWM